MSADVSVVIPTRNEADDVRATLDALLALEGGAREIVVVDASDDGTPAVVAGYPPPVRLVRQSRGRGRAAARNEGILAARGEIVVVLNADVRLPSDFLARILRALRGGAPTTSSSRAVSRTSTPSRAASSRQCTSATTRRARTSRRR